MLLSPLNLHNKIILWKICANYQNCKFSQFRHNLILIIWHLIYKGKSKIKWNIISVSWFLQTMHSLSSTLSFEVSTFNGKIPLLNWADCNLRNFTQVQIYVIFSFKNCFYVLFFETFLTEFLYISEYKR